MFHFFFFYLYLWYHFLQSMQKAHIVFEISYARWTACGMNSPVRMERLRSEGCRRMRLRLQQREPRVRTSSSLLWRWRLFSPGVDALWTRGWYLLLLLFFKVRSAARWEWQAPLWYLLSWESVGSAPLTCFTLPVSSCPTLETLLGSSSVEITTSVLQGN